MQGALGIVLLQPTYPLAAGFFGSEAKALLAAQPLVAGVQAVDLAAAGLAGAPDVLERPQRFVAPSRASGCGVPSTGSGARG